MNSVIIVIGLIFFVLGILGVYFKIKDSKDNYKDIILPIQGSKFKGNI